MITEPTNISEFEIQAYLWWKLREEGLNVRGEVTHRFKEKGRKAQTRFDLAVFESGLLAGIIEVKAAPIKHKTAEGWAGTRQGTRYAAYGVPVRLVCGMAQADQAIQDAENGSLFVSC